MAQGQQAPAKASLIERVFGSRIAQSIVFWESPSACSKALSPSSNSLVSWLISLIIGES